MILYRFTLFDSLEDDEFDGDVGVHDEEVPRVLLAFKMEIGSIGMSQNNTVSSVKFEEAEKDHHQFSQMSSLNNYNASNWNGFNTTSLNQLLCPDEITENRKFNGDNTGKLNSQLEGEGEGEETHINNIEGKMDDLLAMLQAPDRPTVDGDEEIQAIDFRSISKETRELLDLEITKSKMLEDSLKQAETSLFKQEKLYEDLQTKSQSQFKQQLDMNKNLNEENLRLKQRLNVLESELSQQTEDSEEEMNKITQLFNKQIEMNTIESEKHSLTVQNMEQVNEDLLRQIENLKQSLTNEKDLNQKLQKQLDLNASNSKENLDSLKVNMQNYFEQIKTVTEENVQLQNKNSNTELKLQSIEIKNQSLEAENKSCRQDLEKLNKELQEYRDLTSELRKSISDLVNKRDNEVISGKEAVLALEEKLRKSKAENEFLGFEKKELQEELANFKRLDFENRIVSLEDSLTSSEQARKALQEQLQKSEGRAQAFLQQQKEKSVVTQAFEQTVKEQREMIDELSEKLQERTNAVDNLNYENTDLKLKLNDYQEVTQQNGDMKEQLSQLTDDNQNLKETVANLRKQLYNTSNNLIKQTKTAFEQGNVIETLNQQMQNLDNSLRVAFGDIKRMHVTLESAQRIERPFEPQIPFNQDTRRNTTVQEVSNQEQPKSEYRGDDEVELSESDNLSPPRHISSSFSPNKISARKRNRRDEEVSQSQNSALEYSINLQSNRTSPRKDEVGVDFDHSPRSNAVN